MIICKATLQMHTVKKRNQLLSALSALDMAKFAQRQSEACFEMANLSQITHNANLRHISGWHIFQTGTQHVQRKVGIHRIPVLSSIMTDN